MASKNEKIAVFKKNVFFKNDLRVETENVGVNGKNVHAD
jgi:hypothetical protein